MKILAGTALALALSVASMCPAFTGSALSQTSGMMLNGQITGRIESIDDSMVMVRTSDGIVRTYEIDPELITSLRLSQGSNILINSRNLRSGEIIRIGPQNVLVELDNGETEYFIVTEEERGLLSTGDRVLVTPDQRFTRVGDDIVLTARDVVLVEPIAVATTDTTATVRSTRTEVETSTTTTQVPPPPVSPVPTVRSTTTVQTPVRALW